MLADELVRRVGEYRQKHLYKFLGAGLTDKLVNLSPQLPARLWLELDIVPFVFPLSESSHEVKYSHTALAVDEEADSMARKAIGLVVAFAL